MALFVIANGPSKFDIMASLFDGNSTPRLTVKFSLEDGREAEVAINMIQREDLSGESWKFTGIGNFNGARIRFPMAGYFGTHSRKGTLRF